MLFHLVAFATSVVLGFAAMLWFIRRRDPRPPHIVHANSRSAPLLRVGETLGGAAAATESAVPLAATSEDKDAASTDKDATSTEESESTPTKTLLKKAKTKDHILHLGALHRHKRQPHAKADSEVVLHKPAAAEPASRHVAAAEPPAPVLSHPVYCPAQPPLTDQQHALVEALQQRMASVMIPFYANDPTTYVRFLRARKWDLDKAAHMLHDAIVRRSSLAPLAPLRDLLSLNLKAELFNIDNVDIYGRIILYICVRRHNPKVREIEPSVRGIVWYMDLLWEKTRQTEHKQFVVLMNMLDLGMRNVDIAIVRAMMPVLQNYYPEVIGRIIIVNYPFLIWGVWKVVRPMLDENTQNKVQFIGASELKEHFNASVLPREIGGEWDAPEPKIDLWDPNLDVTTYRADPDEVLPGFETTET